MRIPRPLPSSAALAVVLAVVVTAAPAVAAPITAYEMPFPCSEAWTGTTRQTHSPSKQAVDWNRPDDVGDPVVAAATGIVTTAVPNGTRGYGRYVVLDHGNGESTLYAHLSTVSVGVGQVVDQGTLLGTVGETGNATGPHLHFEERLNGKDVAPWFHGAEFVFGSTQQSQNCPDVPLAGNFVGDGIAELVVFDRATASFQISQPAGPIVVTFGLATDTPVVGDWNGDHVWDIGVRKASSNVFRLRKPDGKSIPVRLGKAGDIPVTGDWNGDGTTDLGVYDITKARFTLRVQDANGLVWLSRVVYGSAGDLPVTGDWDGNGRTDLGVWRPGTAQFFQRFAASPMAPLTKSVTKAYGRPRS